jgi:putative flavoprotein involved in K+ transport
MPFPAPASTFPTKDEMADYLETYAARFELPVRTGARVSRVSRDGGGYLVETGDRRFEAEHVVVAMANYQRPRVPPFASELDPDVVQLHSSEYRNPAQLRDGGVLIVGAGNSGAEIAKELSGTHRTWLSGRSTGEVPFRIDGLAARLFLYRLLVRVIFHRLLTVRTPIGRRVRGKTLHAASPLIRVKSAELAELCVERVPRTVAVRDGRPVLADGTALDVANVVWCTGFDPGFSWIDLPVFDDQGDPLHDRGIVGGEPGLYFVGLHFIYAMSSMMVHGVGRDAERIASTVAARIRAGAAARVRRADPRLPAEARVGAASA